MPNYAKTLTLDVETLPTRNKFYIDALRKEALEKRPAMNVAKVLKEIWDTPAEQEKRFLKKFLDTATDCLFAEPIVVCWKVDGQTDFREGIIEDTREASEKWLQWLADRLDEVIGPDTIIIGHNIEGYDLGVLLNSWRRYEIHPPDHFPQPVGKRWFGCHVYDTMLRAPNKNGLSFVKMDTVRMGYELPPAKNVLWNGMPMDGSRVREAFLAGKFQLLLDYCGSDVDGTWELYQVMTHHGGWGTWGVDDSVRSMILEIRASDMTAEQKALAIFNIMETAGRIPRH
jgi:hypothetical protein